QKYLIHLKRTGKRKASQRSYLQNLSLLLRHIPKLPKEYTKKDINKYLDFLEEKYVSKTQKERKLFLIYFLSWFQQKEKHEIDLIKDIKIKKINGTKLPQELFSPEEIKKLTEVASNFRNKAIVMLLYETAARRGEFLQLRIKHVELQEKDNKKFGFVTVPMGKTDSRKIPVIYSMPHIINWINAHPDRDNPEAPLFINLGSYLGQALGQDGLKRILKKLSKRAFGRTKKGKLKKNVYPHLFRHSRLTELAKELTEQELKKFAGWTPTSNMAAVYVHLAGEDVSNKILANAGLIDSKIVRKGDTVLMQVKCPSCDKLNPSTNKICSCGRILDLKEAQNKIDEYKESETTIEKLQSEQSKLKNKMDNMQNQILSAIKDMFVNMQNTNDPESKSAQEEILKNLVLRDKENILKNIARLNQKKEKEQKKNKPMEKINL
ncbi:tyrosine-type recombinase/integrase, partial [Candidatus Woesearchaeota archaeon]|nr:tyrosine-type recombinase/integrase [Candidatus Woesearchaeota archaeon]